MTRRSLGTITPAGPGRWYLRLSIGRDPITGERTRPRKTVRGTKQDAERALAEMVAKYGRDTPTTQMTLGDYLTHRYLPWAEENVGPHALRSYRLAVNTHLKPLHHLALADLTPWHVDQWVAGMGRDGRGLPTQERAFGVLRRALRAAVRWGVLRVDPTDRCTHPRARPYRPVILSPAQAGRLLSAVADTRIDLPVHLALGGGLRRSENLGLRWENVREDGVWVRRGWHGRQIGTLDTKTDTSVRFVHLPAWALASIDRRIASHHDGVRPTEGWVHPGQDEGAAASPDWISEQFRDVARGLGLTLPFKDLRHSCATLLLAGGADLKVVQQTLGHAKIATTAGFYLRPDGEAHRKAAAALDDLVGHLGPSSPHVSV